VLQGLPVALLQPSIDLRKIPAAIHGQLPTQMHISQVTGVARAGLETTPIAFPYLMQSGAKAIDRFARHSPASGQQRICLVER